MDVDILRHLTDGVIQALNVLHKSNFVHKNIRPSSIFIDTSSQIRLTDYCLEPKINEIFSITGKSSWLINMNIYLLIENGNLLLITLLITTNSKHYHVMCNVYLG